MCMHTVLRVIRNTPNVVTRARKMASQPFSDDSTFAMDISRRMRVPESIRVTGEAASPASSSFAVPDLARDHQLGDSSVMEASFQSMIAERTKMSVPEHITLDKNTTPTRGPRTSSRADHRDDPFEFYSPLVTTDRKTPAGTSRSGKETTTLPNSRVRVYIPEEAGPKTTIEEEDEAEEEEEEGEDDPPVDDDSLELEVDDRGLLDGRGEESVLRRMSSLEREVASLHRRVDELENGVTVGNSAVLATLFVFWIVNPIVFHLWYK